jgi:DNA-binding transcriptional regulator GbsR (MarR family)
MGSRWGINRTVGQIYALLFLSETPLCADDIVDELGVSRSNVSTSLKELQSWNLVRLRHVPDDRRDHFTTPDDMWEIVRTLVAERKKREIDPTLAALRECVEAAGKDKGAGPHVRDRLAEMLDFFETTSAWYGHVRRLPRTAMLRFVRMGSRIAKLVG